MLISGCASQPGLERKEGVSRVYDATFEDVKAASRHSVETLNVKINRIEDRSPGEHWIWFVKPVSAWSWGEYGLVKVAAAESGAVVEVSTDKSYKLQVTGTGQDEFAEAIFSGIEQGLKDLASQ